MRILLSFSFQEKGIAEYMSAKVPIHRAQAPFGEVSTDQLAFRRSPLLIA
jgi:hypothetical protein